MGTKPRIGIESPLKGDYERNIRYAKWCMYDCLIRGEAPYASHLLYPQVLNDKHPIEREMGISAGEAFYDILDYRAFYTDLGMSEGMKRAFFRSLDSRYKAFWALFKASLRALFGNNDRYHKRKLPEQMMEAFEAGKCPDDFSTF